MEEEKLEAQMEYAKFEHETEMLRERMGFPFSNTFSFFPFYYLKFSFRIASEGTRS